MDEVAPSDVATLNAQRVAGILTAGSGAAQRHHCPGVGYSGHRRRFGPVCSASVPNTLLLLDGERGELLVAPSDTQLEQARASAPRAGGTQAPGHERRLEPAITRDGHPVEIAANIGAAGETPRRWSSVPRASACCAPSWCS